MESHRRLLEEAGYPVVVLSGRGAGVVIPELDSRHPEVEAITQRLAAGDVPVERFEKLRERVAERLDEVLAGADLVLAHNVLTMHFNLPLAAALAGRRVLAWTHDLAWTNPRYIDFQRDGFPYDILHRPAPGARYVAISARVRGQLLTTYGVPAEVVPNGVDRLALLRIRPSTRELLAGAGLLDAAPLVFTPVRVTRRKRLELALEAVVRLAARLPGLKLVVSGPLGPHSADSQAYWSELADLRRRLGLESRVVFLHELGPPHPVDDEMVAELYQLAAAVLLTSESEGFGLPVLEAGLTRVPVVCADLDVFREVAAGLAWTYPPEAGPEAVAAALEAALGTNTAQLQQRAAEGHDWRHILPRIEREIELALA
ncbi:MAG: glycosyltransferase family 4 protein [Chloroflexi bacterium]|nr:MAG: glycosyltransferase family 4 protein [Chloroflexota bacterium]